MEVNRLFCNPPDPSSAPLHPPQYCYGGRARLRVEILLRTLTAVPRRAHPWLLVLILSFSSLAQGPSLIRTGPLALSPGGTTPLTLIGERLAPGGTLWTSFPAEITTAETTGTNPVFRITLKSNPRPAIGALRFANSNGISDLHLVMIDPLPGVAATGTNVSAAAAQLLKPPLAVDGQCDELKSHFYRLELRRRERVVIDTVANRIGSQFDPFLRVLDGQGRELENADDTPGCGADARLEFVAPAKGSYLIEIRDTRYAGGPDHFYRLRVGDLGAEPLRFLPLAQPLPPVASELPLISERETGGGTAETPRRKRPRKERSTKTDGDDLRTATLPQTIQPPALIRGHFDFPNDRDAYEFSVAKEERWIVRGRTRSLVSPCDLYLRLERPDGTLLIEADATGAGEGSLTNKTGAAGTVRLVVEELNHGGGPGFDYEIDVVPFEPGFTLSVATNALAAAPGGSFELKVNAARRDFDGPITLSVAGLGEGLTLTNHVIAEKQTTNTMTVTVPSTLSPGDLTTFTVLGSAEVDGKRSEARASTMPALKAQFPQVFYPPRGLDGLIWLGVKAGPAP